MAPGRHLLGSDCTPSSPGNELARCRCTTSSAPHPCCSWRLHCGWPARRPLWKDLLWPVRAAAGDLKLHAHRRGHPGQGAGRLCGLGLGAAQGSTAQISWATCADGFGMPEAWRMQARASWSGCWTPSRPGCSRASPRAWTGQPWHGAPSCWPRCRACRWPLLLLLHCHAHAAPAHIVRVLAALRGLQVACVPLRLRCCGPGLVHLSCRSGPTRSPGMCLSRTNARCPVLQKEQGGLVSWQGSPQARPA